MSPRAALPIALLLALVLSGCASNAGDDPSPQDTPVGEAPAVEATATTGGIRGVVVDERVVPIKGAFVEVVGTGKNLTTGQDGVFVFSGLEPGDYIVKARHDLYNVVQASATVKAGEDEPKAVKIQLQRTVFATPYLETQQFDGFIVCSANAVFPLIGGVLSEECGEGVGVPGQGRVGGQGNNNVQYDFRVGNGVRSLVVEQSWEATSAAGSALYSPISTDWSCEPVCDGNTFATIKGPSPTYAFIGNGTIDPLNLTADKVISIFTWASPDTTPIGVTLNQKFTDYVTASYYLPLPEGWSFIGGSPNPFV